MNGGVEEALQKYQSSRIIVTSSAVVRTEGTWTDRVYDWHQDRKKSQGPSVAAGRIPVSSVDLGGPWLRESPD